MEWQYTPYTIPLVLASVFSFLLALHVRRRRRTKEASSIALLMLAVGVWTTSYAFQLSCATVEGQIFWNKVAFFGVVSPPVFWFIFSLQYSGRQQWLSKRSVLLLFLVPLITLSLVWTNEQHGLVWKTFELEDTGSFLAEASTRGRWVWIHIAYSYLVIIAGLLLIFERLINSKLRLYRGQAAALLFFSLAPLAGNLLFLAGIHPFPHVNITPFIFTITCPVLAWGLFRFRLADLVPVAHAAVIEGLNDGIIVLDEQNRVVEANPAAQRFLDLKPSRLIGLPLEQVFSGLGNQPAVNDSTIAFAGELAVDLNNRRRVYDIRFSPLDDGRGRLVSQIVVMRDITDRKLAEAELQSHRDHLEEMVQKRTAELSETNEYLLSEIVQRQRIEGALRDSEQKYKVIVENSNDIIMLTAPNGIILYLSPSCREILEYEPEELVGSEPWLVHPEDLAKARDGFRRALAGQSGSDFEYRIITKSGKTKWLSHSWSPIVEDGRLQMIVSSVRDMTERKTVEEALRQSEERYRMLVDNLLTGICVNQNGILKFVNNRVVEMSGYTAEELLDSGFDRLVHPEDRALIDSIVRRRLSGSDPTGHYEFRGIKKNGQTIWIESFGGKIDYQDGEALLVNLNDITDRKKAEEALKESEQRYRTLVEEAKDIIYTIDLKTNSISNANTFSEEILGYRRQDVIGSNFLDVIFPEDREKIAAALTNRINSTEREPNFPFRMRKSDGSALEVEQNSAVIYDESGKPAIYLGIARDVTERKRMEQELRRSEERYRQILNSSHDIIVVVDDKENVLFVNQAYLNYMGADPTSLGQKISSIVHPHDRQKMGHWFRRLVAGGSIRNVQYRIIDKDGVTRWTESNADPIQWPGVEKAVVNIARDISDRKAAEEALRESEERYRSLVDNSLTGVYVIQDGRFKFVNDRLCEMSGFTRQEFADMPYIDIIHPDDRIPIEQIVQERLWRQSNRGQSQFRTVVKDGAVRWVETHGTRIQYQGKPALLVNLLDITERRLMEEALRQSEQKFRSLVEITSDWVWETDTNGIFTYASPKVNDLLGFEPEEVIGRPAFDFMIPEEAEENRAFLQQRAALKQSFAGLEKINRHKNGRLLVLESSGVPFFDSHGRILGYRGIDRDITDRKRADEALRISEERYRSIFEEAPDIFYILDLDSLIIIDANKYALEALGYGPESLGKMHISHIIHPDDYHRAVAEVREMLVTKERLPDFPLRILTAGGAMRHIEQRGVLLYENDRPHYFLGLAHDVTERKLQEEMIHKRNEKLAALYEVAKTANASLELDTVFSLVIDVVLRLTRSDAACIYRLDEQTKLLNYEAFSGFSEDFIKGTDGMKLGEGLHGHVALAKSPLIVHNLPRHSLPHHRPHLSQAGFDSALIVPLLAREKFLGTLTVVRTPGKPYDSEDLDLLTAIANQIVVAMENADLYTKIVAREAHLQSILQTSLDGIAVTSEEQKVVYRNSALSSMFGYTEEDDLSNTDTTNYFAEESYPALQQLRETLTRGEHIGWIMEFKGRRKDGTNFDAEMRLGYFFENGKRFDVGIIRDVTERKRMQFQLLQSSKLAAIGELAAGVAHEINNPISAIDVQTGLMRDIFAEERGDLDETLLNRVQRYLSLIDEQVQRCHRVTDNLLTFSRFPDSRKELFDINQALEKNIQFVSHLSDKKPQVHMHLDRRLPAFYGDPNRLDQVFVNLWNNALKAVDGDGKIDISTRLDDAANIIIEFKDSGAGIPPEIRERIFEPFFTTRPEGEGTGLGLSISYYIIKEMGGTLNFDSHPGKGATFTITLKPPGEH